MIIKLGLPGIEKTITDYGRDFNISDQEDYEDVVTDDGTVHRYTNSNTKKYFTFKYGLISKTDLTTILAEYNRKAILVLKLSKRTIPETYDSYNVLFDGGLNYAMEQEYNDDRYYKNVSFALKEI